MRVSLCHICACETNKGLGGATGVVDEIHCIIQEDDLRRASRRHLEHAVWNRDANPHCFLCDGEK